VPPIEIHPTKFTSDPIEAKKRTVNKRQRHTQRISVFHHMAFPRIEKNKAITTRVALSFLPQVSNEWLSLNQPRAFQKYGLP
jgi:hypothetical protein